MLVFFGKLSRVLLQGHKLLRLGAPNSKSEHECCDHKNSRNITCCAEMRAIFVWGGWLFADGESWDSEEEGEIGEERVGREGIY